jgi:hypothetical protein
MRMVTSAAAHTMSKNNLDKFFPSEGAIGHQVNENDIAVAQSYG